MTKARDGLHADNTQGAPIHACGPFSFTAILPKKRFRMSARALVPVEDSVSCRCHERSTGRPIDIGQTTPSRKPFGSLTRGPWRPGECHRRLCKRAPAPFIPWAACTAMPRYWQSAPRRTSGVSKRKKKNIHVVWHPQHTQPAPSYRHRHTRLDQRGSPTVSFLTSGTCRLHVAVGTFGPTQSRTGPASLVVVLSDAGAHRPAPSPLRLVSEWVNLPSPVLCRAHSACCPPAPAPLMGALVKYVGSPSRS